jgi:hypothetical protein
MRCDASFQNGALGRIRFKGEIRLAKFERKATEFADSRVGTDCIYSFDSK